mmetsp:Transcript_9211/g.23020  ORF Transcript_9211/g.23020 Transcript_9211/m.23020 type:complete len:207 (-) Transcript_9211:397-1017(-)
MADIKPRRPASARPRPAAAAEEETPKEAAPFAGEDDGIYEDSETWLFAVQSCMTTEEISKMGFTNVILLDASRWRPAAATEDVMGMAARAAAGDMHYCFGMKGSVLESLTRSEKTDIEDRLVPALCGRGDVLIVVQNAKSDVEKDPGMEMVGRLVDCIETAYSQASENMVEDLAGVSVVLEKCGQTPILSVTWDDGTTRALEVTEV